MDEIEPLTVRIYRKETGDTFVTVDRWPKHTIFDDVFLKQTDPTQVAVVGDTLTLTVANGQAVYEMGELQIYSMSREAWLVSARLSEWTPDA